MLCWRFQTLSAVPVPVWDQSAGRAFRALEIDCTAWLRGRECFCGWHAWHMRRASSKQRNVSEPKARPCASLCALRFAIEAGSVQPGTNANENRLSPNCFVASCHFRNGVELAIHRLPWRTSFLLICPGTAFVSLMLPCMPEGFQPFPSEPFIVTLVETKLATHLKDPGGSKRFLPVSFQGVLGSCMCNRSTLGGPKKSLSRLHRLRLKAYDSICITRVAFEHFRARVRPARRVLSSESLLQALFEHVLR